MSVSASAPSSAISSSASAASAAAARRHPARVGDQLMRALLALTVAVSLLIGGALSVALCNVTLSRALALAARDAPPWLGIGCLIAWGLGICLLTIEARLASTSPDPH